MSDLIKKSYVPQVILTVCAAIRQAGGCAWLVGGCVRDLALGLRPEDWDIEVYGLEQDVLRELLNKLGRCEQVGKRFGVTKLWLAGHEIDVALPRTEVKSGSGHKGFDVTPDPYIKPERAVLRRDFTINAMMYDPLELDFLDYHHGLTDLKASKLLHVSEAFVEDPLRPLRAMQFAARFQLKLVEATSDLCRKLLAEADSLPDSRVWHEWLKWSRSSYPSCGLQALRDMGWLAIYPELNILIDCQQDKRWHPEGDVWQHVCLVVDEAARLSKERILSGEDRQVLMFAALCHDLGKPLVTFEDEQGNVLAPKHAEAGKEPAQSFLQRIGAPSSIRKKVLLLVREHGAHFSGESNKTNILWLAERLAPVSIKLWEILAEADACGCMPLPPSRPALPWLKKAKLLGAADEKARALVTGKLLMKWGENPSPLMGEVIKRAYAAQLDGIFDDEESAYSWFENNRIASEGK